MSTVTVNADVLDALGYQTPPSAVMFPTDDGRTLAVFTVTALEAQRLEAGITALRTRGAFDRYALDAAMYSVQDAKHTLTEDERA